jgi:hypothetical protein
MNFMQIRDEFLIEFNFFGENTVRAGNLGQISTLMLDCGAIGFFSALLQRGY